MQAIASSPKCRVTVLLAAALLMPGLAGRGQEPGRGHLLIAGGGLRADNEPVYRAFLTLAGGAERARVGVFPTASTSSAGALRIVEILAGLGAPRANLEVIDITVDNAATRAMDPDVVARIGGCTGLFFAGGDQLRITRALVGESGRDTPALAAVREVYRRGGVIAGSSAGAAVQGERMLSVSGLPDRTHDYGMDALDFGVAPTSSRRGLSLTRGLGLFRGGPIDQHFNTYRGRLARLTRALIESGLPRGFGIDEDTAMLVRPDGGAEVIGRGGLTVVDVSEASARDGPSGYRASGVRLSYLGRGDLIDPRTGAVTVHPNRAATAPGAEEWDGNELIPDIFGPLAVAQAITSGLLENTGTTQVGIALRYHGNYGHGYRLTFSETGRTRGFSGVVAGHFGYTALEVRLDIDPITSTLESSEDAVPVDLPTGPAGTAIRAIAFRGIMPADAARRFRPGAEVTRAEFADILCHALVLETGRTALPTPADVPSWSPQGGAIARVVSCGLLDVEGGRFRPDTPLTRREAATALIRASWRLTGRELHATAREVRIAAPAGPGERTEFDEAVRAGLVSSEAGRDRPADPMTRGEAAVAIYRILGFPW